MMMLKALSVDVYQWLSEVDPTPWTMFHFSSHSRSDLLVNNLSRCFNVYIMDARDKPIITMLEIIRRKLMRTYQVKRDGIKKMDKRLCLAILKKVDRNYVESCEYISTYAGNEPFEVEHKQRQYVLNLKERTCGCK